MSNNVDIINKILKELKDIQGIFCLNYFITKCNSNELQNFVKENNIPLNNLNSTKTGYFEAIITHFYKEFSKKKELKKQYAYSLDYIGDKILLDHNLRNNIYNLDYIAKQELIDKFADYCADLGISVYYPVKNDREYLLDLYLIKKTPRLRTEAVFVRTASEFEATNYKEFLKIIEKASKISSWTVLVTSPAGIYKIGFHRLIKDMNTLNVWLYVIDPVHKRILGITKGKSSKDQDIELRDIFIKELREPIRAPSKVVNISSYSFKESESYNPSKFSLYKLLSGEEYDQTGVLLISEARYKSIFRSLLIIDDNSGVPIFSYIGKDNPIDDVLVSGFLTAMDNFVSELGGSAALREINYKGFFIQAVYGTGIKIALFLSNPGDQILKERLEYFLHQFEKDYASEIHEFKVTGKVSLFGDNTELETMIREILSIN